MVRSSFPLSTGHSTRATPRPASVVLQAVAVAIVCGLPPFLVGALIVQIRRDLNVDLTQLGISSAVFFAVSGALARPLGGMVQRIGPRAGLAAAAAAASSVLIVAGTAQDFPVVLASLAVGGAANSVAQAAANMRLSEAIPGRRLGTALGIKQSSIPMATLLGGVAVSAVALTTSWRWAFHAAAAVALVVSAWSLATRPGTRVPLAAPLPARRLTSRGLSTMAIGGGLAAATSTTLGIFLVDSAVGAGMTPREAGLLAVLSSVLGVCARVSLGVTADTHPRRHNYLVVAAMMIGGAFGYTLLATGAAPFVVVGALIGYVAGWSWNGLLHYAVVRDHLQNVGSATGVLQTGLALGAALGPLTLGLLAQTSGYAIAWCSMAAVTILAGVTMGLGHRFGLRPTAPGH